MRSTYILAFLATLAVAAATNYCSNSICPRGERHVACARMAFAPTCPRNARLVDLRPHISTILKLHNQRRNLIAGGQVRGYRPAERMATMQWDDELAHIAAFNVMQCQMKHDRCRSTDVFKYAGQNLATSGYMGYERSDSELIESGIEGWFDEYKDCNMNIINRYPMSYRGPQIGHFTAMVIDSNTHVGCAAARYSKGGWEHFLLACNYARINLIGEPIYKSSNSPASGCRTQRNPLYPNLCSTAEVYQV